MAGHTDKLIGLADTPELSVADAIQSAITRRVMRPEELRKE